MIGLGTLVNVATILVGGFVGIFLSKLLKAKLKETVMQALALVVFAVGVSGVVAGILYITKENTISTQFMLPMIISMVVGTIIGEIIGIEKHLENLGAWFDKKFSKSENTSFAQGFVTASLLFCVGAMAIVGSLQDALGDPSILIAKAIIDGFTVIILAATLGRGAILSALPVGIYQGLLTLLAAYVSPWLSADVRTQMSIVGSLLIVGISINMFGFKKIKVGNMLPAIFIPIIISAIQSLFN